MTAVQVIFWLSAALLLFAALQVVTRRNLVHAALFLVLALFGVAILFVLLQADFMAVIQVLVYIGAIAIMMIFAIMLTRKITDKDTEVFNKNVFASLAISILAFAGIVVMLNPWSGFTAELVEVDASQTIVLIGEGLVGTYLIPFMLVSILLLAALVGAIYIAWPKKLD